MKTLVPPPPPPPPPHKIPIEQRYGEICIFFFSDIVHLLSFGYPWGS